MTAAYFEDHPTDPDKVILRKPKHEYVAFMDVPYKPWVGLTDEEMLSIEETTTCTKDESWLRNVTRAIEAKLKEKNT